MERDLQAALQELNDRVLGLPGVTGTAVGKRCGRTCLKVYVSDISAKGALPRKIRGFRVVVEESGRIRPL
jgi:hypothetical protein